MTSGIYTITAPSNGQYIGSAVDIKSRWRNHRHHLIKGTHINNGLKRAAIKYGISNLKFEILLICLPEDLLLYEQIAIDGLKPRYNACLKAGNRMGIRHSIESREKISKSKTGVKLGKRPFEYVEKTASKLRGRKRGPIHSPEFKARISEMMRLRKYPKSFENNITPEIKARLIGDYQKIGIAKLSIENKVDHRVMKRLLLSWGVDVKKSGPYKRVMSMETRKKISESNRNNFARIKKSKVCLVENGA